MATIEKPTADSNGGGLVTHVHTETPEQVAAFWTPERVSGAVPVPLPALPADATAPAAEPVPSPSSTGGPTPPHPH